MHVLKCGTWSDFSRFCILRIMNGRAGASAGSFLPGIARAPGPPFSACRPFLGRIMPENLPNRPKYVTFTPHSNSRFMTETPDIRPASCRFEEVYDRYRAYFVDIALSYVRDRMVAEDLVTDAFLRVWENRDETTPRNLPAYLLTALRHKCLDWLRNRNIHLKAHLQLHRTEQRIVAERIARLESDTFHSLMISEALGIIEAQLRRMPEQRRKIFIAHRYEEMSYREIAAVYGLSEGQVTYELRMAREALKVALKDYLPLVALLVEGGSRMV